MFLPRDGVSIDLTPTVDTSAYTSGDVLFVANKLSNATLNTKGMSYLRNILVFDADNQKQAMDLLFFDRSPGSVGTINNALDMTAAQMSYLVGIVNIATGNYTTLKAATNAVGLVTPNLFFQALQNMKEFWVVGVARGNPTYTSASSLVFKFVMERHA